MKRTVACLSLLCASGLGACGGSPAPDAAAAAPVSEASPGARCLAEATAEAARRDDEPAQIGVKHILVKHAQSERAPADVTRTREEACLRALSALEALKGGADFDEVVATYSDEAGAETRGGSLGSIRRDDVDPAFADAAFALDLNAVTHVVETKFGFHIILRTD